MSCKDCNKNLDDCGCGPGGIHVSPPSECNTPECPEPEVCSEATPTTCLQYVGEDKTCGEDTVYEQGDLLDEVNSKIVSYFCQKISDLGDTMVKSVTGDGVNNTDPFNPVIDLSDYALISNISAVGFSNDYNDLDNLPVIQNFATDDLIVTGNRVHDLSGFSVSLTGGKMAFGYNSIVPGNNFTFSSISATGTDKIFAITNINFGSYRFWVNNDGDYSLGSDTTGRRLYSSQINRITYNTITNTEERYLASGLGEFPVGTAQVTFSNSHYILADIQNGTAGKIVGLGYFSATDCKSAVEVANVASGFGTLILMKTGGMVKTVSPSNTDSDTAFTVRNNADSAHLFKVNALGRISTFGTSVGNAGLSPGDVYMDTAANILSNGDLILAVKQ